MRWVNGVCKARINPKNPIYFGLPTYGCHRDETVPESIGYAVEGLPSVQFRVEESTGEDENAKNEEEHEHEKFP